MRAVNELKVARLLRCCGLEECLFALFIKMSVCGVHLNLFACKHISVSDIMHQI